MSRHLDPPEDHPGYDWNEGHHNGAETPKSHKGGQVDGCICADCEDTREYLKVCLEAMVEQGAGAEVVRCDGCAHWIIDGAPENGRVGRQYCCPECYGKKMAALKATPLDFHDSVRR